MNQRQQSSTSYPINFYMVLSSDHVSPATGKTVTAYLSKNGGSLAAASGAVTEIGNGWYSLTGNATDRATLGELLLRATASGCDETPGKYVIVPWDPFNANLGLTNLDAAVSSRSTYAGGAVASVTADVGITQAAADKVWGSTASFSATLIANLASAIWGALTSGMTTLNSIGKKLADWVLGSDKKVLVSGDLHNSGMGAYQVVNDVIGKVRGSTSSTLIDDGVQASLSPDTVNAIADALLDRADGVEASLTPRQALRLVLAVLAGKAAENAGTVTFKRKDGSTTALTVAHDDSGNRTTVTIGTV